ncbi:TPA: hypothetical protein IBG13_004714 [Escherichia coli]|nr:hypothetical protein [Escherichia coli]
MLTIPLFIILVLIILFFNLSTSYEISDDSYTLSIKKNFLNINNLSSLTYSSYDGYLYATVNKPAKVLKISTDGNIHQIKNMPFIKDAESIEHFTENMFLAADEETSMLYLISINKDMEIKIKKSIQLDIFKKIRTVVLKVLAGTKVLTHFLLQRKENQQNCSRTN